MFLKFDIVSFYPSITLQLLKNTIQYAKSVIGIFIPKDHEDMIMQCRKSFLFSDSQSWKKVGNNNFDVQMGCFDGAEICELVGLYLLHKLTTGVDAIFEKDKVGIYRDDGLAIIKINQGGRTSERKIKWKQNSTFNSENLKIAVEPATQVTDYLDVKLNLSNHTHDPFRKPNDTPSYINVHSNHPKHIIEYIPKMIEQRLSLLSSNEEIFERNKAPYEKTLYDSGYKSNLKYQGKETTKKKNRSKKIILFIPPYSKSIKTNVIKEFLNLIDKYFPKGNKLYKCFNRSNMKATYCSLTNMKEHIGKYNSKVLNINAKGDHGRNCRNKAICPLPNNCNQTNVVYQADVHGDGKVMKYFGSSIAHVAGGLP